MENMCPPLVPPGRSKQSDCGTPVPESPPPYPLFANICCGANGKFSPFVYGTVADADFGYLVKQQGGGGAKFIVQPQQQQQSQQQQPFASSSISATNGTSPFSHHQQQQQPLAVEGKKTCERPFLLKKTALILACTQHTCVSSSAALGSIISYFCAVGNLHRIRHDMP